MEKKIDSYLPFYLGCIVSGIYGIGYLRGIDKNGWCMVTWKKDMAQGDEDFTQHDKETEIKHVKPHLRPLSSMTEEELVETLRIFEPTMELEKDRIKGAHKSIKRDGIKAMIGNEDYDMSKYAVLIHYLLSRHFDLFNLIPEGLAINKQL